MGHSFDLLLLCLLCSLCGAPALAAPANVANLRCEDVLNPLGVDEAQPRLSWIVESDERGWKQRAYRVLVASGAQLLAQDKGDLWDSGQVPSDETTQVAYAGKPLASRRECFWKVRVVDAGGVASPWSQPARWEMGLLAKSDWHGQWIGYAPPHPVAADDAPTLENAFWIWYPEGDPLKDAPEATRYFRRTVALPAGRKITSARLRVAADNAAVITIDGQEVGRAHDSWKTRAVFDVKKHLAPGANVLAVAVTNEGTAAGLAAQLDVKFEAGEPLTIVTGKDWKTSQQAPPAWNSGAFDDAAWVAAKELVKVGGQPWGPLANESAVPAPPAPHLRRAFEIKGKVRRATAYICGLGYHELRLNGRKVGDHELDPGWTRYDKRALYVAHDVTSYLQDGANALGVILGTGHYDDHVLAAWDFDKAAWRDRPKLLLELRVDYADGRTQTIASDAGWKASTGPLVFDSISAGETYDARLEMPGWDTANYDAKGWQKAQSVEPIKGILAAQIAPPVKVTQVLKPVKVNAPKPGVFVFDLGQNCAGVPQLTVSGPAGAKVIMRCAEKLHPDGTLDAGNIETFVKRRDAAMPFQTDTYILKGAGVETWQPRFTYHGFQYVEMTGFPGTPTLDNLRGLVLHSAFASVGTFECSNPLFNAIQHDTLWSYRSNFHGIPTDCPHREKNGWMGDAHLAAEMGLYNFDGAANYEKWLNDIQDEQRPDGTLPGIVPTGGWGYKWGNGPAWDSAYPLICWYLYQYRGDRHILARHYDNLKRYVDYATTRSKDGLVAFGLGDWVAPKTKTPLEVTDTGYYYVDTLIVAQAAQLLGKAGDAKKYGELAASIKQAFNARLFNPQTGQYANGSLTAQSCALFQGLVEPEHKAAVVNALVAEVEKQDYHMDVGILGAKYLLNALADNGRADIAYRILMQKTAPSYGNWIERGATTLWEDWPGNDSRNHIMFGDVSAWFYKNLAGINAGAPGFKSIVIKPHVLGDLTFARATYDSMQGRIASAWKLENGAFQLDVTIPANASATVYVPSTAQDKITESGQPVEKAAGVKFLRRDGEYAVFEVGSGTYRFAR